jgi:hypothetical protein
MIERSVDIGLVQALQGHAKIINRAERRAGRTQCARHHCIGATTQIRSSSPELQAAKDSPSMYGKSQ